MKKYHLSNYINNKTASIYQTELTCFSEWNIIYYHEGKMVGYSTFSSEQEALLDGISYIKNDTIKEKEK